MWRPAIMDSVETSTTMGVALAGGKFAGDNTSGMLCRISKSTLERPNHCKNDKTTEPLVRPVPNVPTSVKGLALQRQE